MQDGSIKGNGTSRYFKTAADALDRMPDYPSFMRELIAGTFTMDFNGINRDGWRQIGTPLDTANMLSEDTGRSIGAETQDEALAKVNAIAAAAMSSASAGVRVVTGSYAGAGTNSKTLDVGFRPKFVAITVLGSTNPSTLQGYLRYESSTAASGSNYYGVYAAIYAGQGRDAAVRYSDTSVYCRTYAVSDAGITMKAARYTSDGSSQEPSGSSAGIYAMNGTGVSYYWVAIG